MTIIITEQPQDVTVEEGVPAFFSVEALGSGTLSYQWYTLPTGAIVGEVADNLTVGGISLSMDGKQYYVTITDDDETVQSNTVTLSVTNSTDCPGYACDAYTEGLRALTLESYYPMTAGLADTNGTVTDGGKVLDAVGSNDLTIRTTPVEVDNMSLLADACAGAGSFSTAYTGEILDSLENFAPILNQAPAGTGSVGLIVDTTITPADVAGTQHMQLYWATKNFGNYSELSIRPTQNPNEINVGVLALVLAEDGQLISDDSYDMTLTGLPDKANVQVVWETIGAAPNTLTTVTAYLDWDYDNPLDSMSFAGSLNTSYFDLDQMVFMKGGGSNSQDVFIASSAFASATFTDMALALARNSTTYIPPRGCSTAPPTPIPRTSLVWNFEDDNFTWMDAAIDMDTKLDPVVCMHYNFDAGFQTRWSDLDALGVLWSDLQDQGTRWSDFYGGGQDQNMLWLSDTGVYKSDQVVTQSGMKTYFVEKTNIDLDESLGITTNKWKHLRQFYFHLKSNRAEAGIAENNFTFSTGWSKNLMDAPDWHAPITVNLQTTANDGRHKVDLRTTGRYLALRIDFTSTLEFAMTGGDLDVEPTHGR